MTGTLIGQFDYAFGKTSGPLFLRLGRRRARTEKLLWQGVGDERTRTSPRLEVAFAMQLFEGQLNRQSSDAEILGERARRRKARRVGAKGAGNQFIPNLAVELLMERLARAAIQPDHLERDNGATAAFPIPRDLFHLNRTKVE